MWRLIWFAWNKALSMDADVSAVESTGIYPFNRNRMPEYFLSISDTSKTVTFMETAPPNMALICALSTSGTNSQSVTYLSRTFIKCSEYYTAF